VELNWSTFLLELVNFLVLVWILKRFLYRPVLDIIARRRAGIEATLAEADARQQAAQQLQAQYEGRLADWEEERRQARDVLAGELEREREQQRSDLQAELDRDREKARVTEARRQADTLRQLETAALAQAAGFATRLLEQAAGPELHARLVDLVTGELNQLPAARVSTLRNRIGETASTALVSSALPLSGVQQQGLARALAAVTGDTAATRFEQRPELLAGVRIELGGWVLGANLQDELRAFAELAHE
jgi:F-type H+-transporting ATPase subunit b